MKKATRVALRCLAHFFQLAQKMFLSGRPVNRLLPRVASFLLNRYIVTIILLRTVRPYPVRTLLIAMLRPQSRTVHDTFECIRPTPIPGAHFAP